MVLVPEERRALARIEGSLRRSDPRLAGMLETFSRLAGTPEALPWRERVPRWWWRFCGGWWR